MAFKNFKFAILRARHDQSVSNIPDRSCLEMFFSNAQRRSVFNYWETVTDDYLQFDGSSLQPWVDVDLAGDTSRNNQVAMAYAATAALPGASLDGFDGFIVLSHPGTVSIPNPKAGQPGQPSNITKGIDGGAGPVVAGKPACALPIMTGDHTFFCHEVGHVLGFEHSYGVWNNGIDWDGLAPFDQGQVYGDPYDIMSSATFGTRSLDPSLSRYFSNPTFAGPAVVDWPNPGSVRMGPEPARAHIHLWDPAAIAPQRASHVPGPVGQGVRSCRLSPAGRHAGTTMLVIHPPGEDMQGRGRCYVEYRERTGWDQGLDLSGSDLARQAIVVHTLSDTATDGVRCWYRGHISIPLEVDTDLIVDGTPYVVRVTDVDLEGGVVEVEVAIATADRALTINTEVYEALIAEQNPQPIGTPCGDTIISATRIWQTTTYFRPTAVGIGGVGAPDTPAWTVAWTVGGMTVAPGSGTLEVPTDQGVFTIQTESDSATGELVLVARGGERYGCDVTAAVTDPGGSTVTASSHFNPIGWTEGYSASDLAKLDACMVERLHQVGLRPQDWLVPNGPDPQPGWRRRRDAINEARLRVIANMVNVQNPAEGRDLLRMIEMRHPAHQ